MHKPTIKLSLTVLAFNLAVSGLVWAGRPTLSPVKVEATAGKIEADNQTINVTLTMQKPWHVYANPVKNAEVAENKTVITVNGKVKPTSVEVRYPSGVTLTDKYIGKFNAYEQQVTIPVIVQRAPGDTGPLELSVRFNSCDANKCLPTKTVKLSVP